MLSSGCVVVEAPAPHSTATYPALPAPAPAYQNNQIPPPAYDSTYAQGAPAQAPEPVVSVYVEPPVSQPEPIAVPWAPPPMLVEVPPPQPFDDAVWIGGYWVWQGGWVWAAGRWAPAPYPHYHWHHPYYENRNGVVIFITGHWCAPGVEFVPPPMGLHIDVVVVEHGWHGHPPSGPQGVFVPPPPGSRPGLIVPAPIGTPPAVVISAPPIVNVGMHIQSNTTVNNVYVNNLYVNRSSQVSVVVPPGATANGRGYQAAVPTQAHLAAAMPAVVHATAPAPQSSHPVPAYTPASPHAPLPPAQPVTNTGPTAAPHGAPQPYPQAQPAQPSQQNPQGQLQQRELELQREAQMRHAAPTPAPTPVPQERSQSRPPQGQERAPTPQPQRPQQDVPHESHEDPAHAAKEHEKTDHRDDKPHEK